MNKEENQRLATLEQLKGWYESIKSDIEKSSSSNSSWATGTQVSATIVTDENIYTIIGRKK